MPILVDELTDAQRATFEPYVRGWIERATDVTPLDDDGRAAVVAGIRRCYEAAGLPWHGNVVWVGSPFVGEEAAPIAAERIERIRNPPPPPPPPPPLRHLRLREMVAVAAAAGFVAASTAVMLITLWSFLPSFLDMDLAVGTAQRMVVIAAAAGTLIAAVVAVCVRVEVPVPPRGKPIEPVTEPTAERIRVAVPKAVRAAVDAAAGEAVRDLVSREAHDPVRAALRGLDTTLERVVDMHRHDHEPLELDERLLREVVPGVVEQAVAGPFGERPGPQILTPHVGLYTASILAGPLWLREHAGLLLPDDLWELADAYLAAARAGWWWPTADFVIISERPREMSTVDTDALAPRIHSTDGPALRWSDGFVAWCDDGRSVDPPGRERWEFTGDPPL